MTTLSLRVEALRLFIQLHDGEKSLRTLSSALQLSAGSMLDSSARMEETNAVLQSTLGNVFLHMNSIKNVATTANEYLLSLNSESALFVEQLTSNNFHTAALELLRHIIKLDIKHLLAKSMDDYLRSIANSSYNSASDIFTDAADPRLVKAHQLLTRVLDRYYDIEGFMLQHLSEYMQEVRKRTPHIYQAETFSPIEQPPPLPTTKVKTRSLHTYSLASHSSWESSVVGDIFYSISPLLLNLRYEYLSQNARASVLAWAETIHSYIESGLSMCYSTVILLLFVKPRMINKILVFMGKCHGLALPCIFRLKNIEYMHSVIKGERQITRLFLSSICSDAGSLLLRPQGNTLPNYAAMLLSLLSEHRDADTKNVEWLLTAFRYSNEQLSKCLSASSIASNQAPTDSNSDKLAARTSQIVVALAIAEFTTVNNAGDMARIDTYVASYPPSHTELLTAKRPISAFRKAQPFHIPISIALDPATKVLIKQMQALYLLSHPFVTYVYKALEFCSNYVHGASIWSKILSVSPDFFNLILEEQKNTTRLALQDFFDNLHGAFMDALQCIPIGEKLAILQACLTHDCEGIAAAVAQSIEKYIKDITQRRDSIRNILAATDSTFAFMTGLFGYLHQALTMILPYSPTRMLHLVSNLIKMLEHEYVSLSHKRYRGIAVSQHLQRLTTMTKAIIS